MPRLLHGTIAKRLIGLAMRATLLSLLSVLPATAADLDQTLQKANLYLEVAKYTERAAESFERYREWVNLETGPTGQEEYISYGLYDVPDPASFREQVAQAAAIEPAAPELDAVMARYLAAYEAVAPHLNRAAAYYDSQSYTADKLAEGKALHEKIVPLSQAFLAERVTMLAALTPFVRDVQAQWLASIEAAEGRSERWQVANVMYWADRIFDVFPKPRPVPMSPQSMDAMMQSLGPDSSGAEFDQLIAGVEKPKGLTIDMARLDAEMKGYAEAVGLFDAFAKSGSDEIAEFRPMPRAWLEALKGLQAQLAPSNGQDMSGAEEWIGQVSNGYIQMLNESNGVIKPAMWTLPWS